MKSPSPTACSLEDLPLDILEKICAELAVDLGQLEKLSLVALASTSRRLRFATARFQFQTIKIRFIDKSDLPHEVERWREILGARNPVPYVRRISIVEEEKPLEEWEDDIRKQWPPNIEEDFFDRVEPGVWPLDKDDEFWTRPEPIDFNPWGAVPTPSAKAEEQKLWAPVADFITSLRSLRDVDYLCKDQVPVTVLAALNEKDDGPVRLHVYGFSLRSLYQHPSHPDDIDEDEFYLATSPCLSSIRLQVPHHLDRTRGADHEGRHCFVEDAVEQMIEGFAPNLKSVSVVTTYSQRTPRQEDESTWSGFFPTQPTANTALKRGKGALETIALESVVNVGPDTIRAWSRLTDFTLLRSLHLRTYTINAPTLDLLSEIAESAGLRSLRSLSLWTTGFWENENEDSVTCDLGDTQIARLLRALSPLQSLELKGTFHETTLEAILDSHGASLQSLRLVPERDYDIIPLPFVLTRKRVESLVQACPNLQDLELLVPRSKGDEEEARIYRALAELPRLDRLSLFLDCSNVFEVEEDPGPFVPDIAEERIRDVIINLNTSDRALATDIFDALCLHRSPRLIRLYPAEIRNFGTEVREWSMLFIRDCLSRAWVRQRDDRAGHAGEFRITEIVAKDRFKSVREPLKGRYYTALDSIWPDAEPWPEGIDEMKSFPLWKPS
ncbi:hypothetical protein C8A01DRAFT_38929 [Parachaetomium inaequale]|uniref:Uncharacterized protein n=1 Tax=Parachaetomium inaequale TaxID=2588326 RepID=A0AAN6PEQ5_9PEZI|nr:hypothetical protein C8A01DRAFT_38929 [Parachaetomium inaequale]